MKKLTATLLGMVFVMAFVVTAPAYADQALVSSLKGEVKDLNRKVESLQRQMQNLASGGQKRSSYVPSASGGGGLFHTMQDINVTGFVDVGYNQNLDSQTTNIGGNPLRTFDDDQNTFALHNFELNFEKLANPEGGAGFRVDISMGEDPEFVDAATVGADADEFSLQQAYIQVVAPMPILPGLSSDIFADTVDIKVGRFVTLAGTEVLEGGDNWNISRSFLFGLAIPFTHTGIRAEYNLFNDKVTTYWGVNNGWDANIDNNIYKTIEVAASWSPMENVGVTHAFYFGPETARRSGRKRYLLTNVVTWDATDRLSFIGEISLGTERRTTVAGGITSENAQWHGYAVYARYQLTDKFAMASRFEFFRDDDNFRTGGIPAGTNALWSPTFTLEYAPYDNLITRLEYRFDHADDGSPFNAEAGQSTLGAQMIYSFA